jgi:hypothetical protein
MPLALTEPALLSAIIFCISLFKTGMGGQDQPCAIGQLLRSIRILNGRLQHSSQEISDSTIALVAGLSLNEVSGSQRLFRTA